MAVVYSQPDTGMVFLYAAAIACILFMSGIQKEIDSIMYSYSVDHIICFNIYFL